MNTANININQAKDLESGMTAANNTNKMTATRSVKVTYKGTCRLIELPSPATLARLQDAFATAFGMDLPPRSNAGSGCEGVSFTFEDPDGDDIIFDKDSELSLATKLCPGTLSIAAKVVGSENGRNEEPAKTRKDPDKIYRVAARNLREYNGVPSMTSDKLKKTLDLLQLRPRRLVRQGLAPKKLLPPAGQNVPADNEKHDDFAEAAVADMEVMSMEDDKKEYKDGFVEVCSHHDNDEVPAAVAPDIGDTSESSSDDSDEPKPTPKPKPKMPLHAALITAGIKIRPREVRPLLLALGVRPLRFVKLGLVDADAIPRGPRARGPWGPHGKPCGRMRGHYSVGGLFGPPPPPPPFAGRHAWLAGRRGAHGPDGSHGRRGMRGSHSLNGVRGPCEASRRHCRRLVHVRHGVEGSRATHASHAPPGYYPPGYYGRGGVHDLDGPHGIYRRHGAHRAGAFRGVRRPFGFRGLYVLHNSPHSRPLPHMARGPNPMHMPPPPSSPMHPGLN